MNSLKSERLACLDAFRGFDILAMTFVNYIAGMTAIPFILRHAKADMDAYTLSDVVFPGFLFIVGVAIPLSLQKRIDQGDSLLRILKRIVIRTAALVFLGVLMVNKEIFSAKATGISHELWFFLICIAVIALWTVYPRPENRRCRVLFLMARIAAASLLGFLLVILRTHTEGGGITWLQVPWWGILGLIGWVYLACSLLYLLAKEDRTALLGAMGLMIALFIGWRHGLLDFIGSPTEALNIGIIFGSHGAIVTAGMVVGTLFTPRSAKMTATARLLFIGIFGAGLLVSGYLFRPLHGFSKIRGTESYALATSGICCLLFMIFYWLMDVIKARRWASFLQPIGANPLLAFLLPSMVDSLLDFASSIFKTDVRHIFWPFWGRGGYAGMANALAMTGVILLLTWAMTRAKIILKL
jgi:predicted acyltransferase